MAELVKVYDPGTPIQWTWLPISGPDSQDFLHRITTAHVKSLQPGQGTEACLLSATGKIELAFTLWNTAPGSYGFEFDSGIDGHWLVRAREVLERYLFSENLTIGPQPDTLAVWIFDHFENDRPGTTRVLENGARLCAHGSAQFGRLWSTIWGTRQQIDYFQSSWNKLSFETVERWRIERVRPRVGTEIDESIIPLELGMVSSIAKTKGCYPGQEVIERISASGAPPRRLVKLECRGAVPSPGESVIAPDGSPVGRITSVSPGTITLALALMKKTSLGPGVQFKTSGSQAELNITQVAPDA